MTKDQAIVFAIIAGMMALFVWGRLRYDLVACIALLAAWGDQLLRLWVGAEFTSSYATLVVLTTGVLAIAIQGTAGQVLLALDGHRLMASIAGVEALCNLGLSIVLGLRFGIVGVALGTAIPTVITAFGITLPYACRQVGASYASLMRPLVGPAAIAGGAYLVMAGGQRLVGAFPNLGVLGLASAALLALTLAASLLADREGRRTYLPMIRGLAPRRPRTVQA